jgi:2-polyprenyl-6-methoxyphenol hydroxylase-like FAD-dependent oxidoreductase
MTKPILIAGTTSLSLNSLGIGVRIVDKAPTPPTESRAIGINPRSLQIFEKFGVAERIIEAGQRLNALCIRHPHRIAARIDLRRLKHERNYMIALPQSQTVAILSDALAARGVSIERATELTAFTQNPSGVACTLSTGEILEARCLLGADGAHSAVRKILELPFPGAAYEKDWHLADVRMTTPYPSDEVHIVILKGGLMLMITIGDGLWRIAANLENVKSLVPEGCTITETLWESSFKISHRQVPSYHQGSVFLAGDAAHIHSPAGGRGMNLGIEDAWVFANLLVLGKEAKYSDLRLPVGKAVVRQTDLITRVMSARNPGLTFMRNWILLPQMKIPAVANAIAYRMAALDRVDTDDHREMP